MGLGFRWRLVFLLLLGLLLWQTSKIWLAFLQDGAVTPELEVDQAATPLSEDGPAPQKVHVAVYYEALCPDSRSFVLKQLGPTYRKLLANMEIQLVPYGKAKTTKTNDGYQFVCQHGPIECQANIVHACSIDVIEDPSVRLQFVACMIENNIDPIGIMNTCARRISVDLDSLKECTNTERGKELLAKYGEMTNSLAPRVSFIPTITLDGSSEHQVRILKNLFKEVCLRFKVTPKECAS
ncbi:PREDICTED: gamma-interferon-inducible lysosomal thiol reductase-like [Vollenhovia emeryi]|uniref:gamma-interferon-inducible lysosomal thiol reductase-like n=1 Tax=Vollenhovia emeryi TaxID=411798 RepID=UPI0005F530DC|nr:PREDICTED: gamma-interferon-inducible lysosomal thiol reductase-like [Vollenhovia emeryi]